MLRRLWDVLIAVLRGGDYMVTVYVTLIVKGYKTFAQVPVNLQPDVKTELAALDLGTDGKPLAPVA
ncbi:hypothetical protein EJQ19_24975 [Paenibacillus whitsoniae]|uniref:Uncharacterized protein n=1 Tax=Paenibacillus whitsoniae TaxID=2496558 RepID=A0A430J7M9_9BACL|nr:hypothetical protein EJQ19_24975 [Paenibacillus whitsoniae]